MGAIGGMLGLSGGSGGTGFSIGGTPIVNPTDNTQIKDAYNGVQQSQQQQQELLNALIAQNGLGNQNQVFKQLRDVSEGLGPNPAQAMLNNSTGQNIANQAAMAAAQRGASGNVGLMARQAGNIGANVQQQAAGQGAAMQANQSMNALNQMGGMANAQVANQVGQTNAGVGSRQQSQQALLNAMQGVNNANVGMQSNMNNNNGQLANTTLGAQQNMIGGIMNGIGAAFKMADGGEVPDVSTPTYAPAAAKSSGGMDMVMKAFPALLAADGGQVPNTQGSAFGPQSVFGKFLAGSTGNGADVAPITSNTPYSSAGDHLKQGASTMTQGIASAFSGGPKAPLMAGGPMDAGGMGSSMTAMAAEGGKVPAMVSPGERYLPPQEVKEVAAGKKSPMKAGEKIPGKPVVGGDKNSYANDVVPKTLESGGIVLPRSVTQAKDPAKKAAEFVAAVLKKQSLKQGSK